MRITFSPRAVADLREISDYIRPRSPKGARNVRSAIEVAIALLKLFPCAGVLKAEGIRMVSTRRYPYLIYYTVDAAAQEVVIVTIRHGSREPLFGD